MAHGESQLTVSIDITGSLVGLSFCEYKPFLPLYQHGYQLTPHVKLKDIQGVFSYYGAISSYSGQQSLVLWSLLNVNHCYIHMNDLYCSVLCDPRSHTDSVVDCLDHGRSVQSFLLWTMTAMFCDYTLHGYRPMLSKHA